MILAIVRIRSRFLSSRLLRQDVRADTLGDLGRRGSYRLAGEMGVARRGVDLLVDREAAVIRGEIMGDGDRTGRPRPMADA